MLPSKIAFIDLETTGGSLNSDSIIEVGVVRVEDNKVVKTFHSMVDPKKPLPESISILTGITPAELKDAPTFYQIKDELLEILDDCVLVAHNARFDYGFLIAEYKRLGISFSKKHLCTVKLSRLLFPEYRHHNLDSIIERFGFECPARHRAFEDAGVLWQFYQHLSRTLETEVFEKSVSLALRRPSVPLKISVEELEKLPQSPGVYIFYGANNLPLYIGKSVNIKERVMSHFSQSHVHSTEMKISQQLERIETVVTSGELGALLKESELIKKMQPLYNRRLRLTKQLIVMKKVQTKDGYYSIDLERVGQIDPEEVDQIIGVFKSLKQAKDSLVNLCAEHQLCLKLLGLEKTNSSCFNYRLGKCKGGCQAKENATLYNFRFLEAFAKTSLRSWPYAQPIIIEEKSDDFESAYLIDKWCYIGSLKSEEQDTRFLANNERSFDLDMYKIISAYLRNSSKKHKIKILHPEELQQLIH